MLREHPVGLGDPAALEDPAVQVALGVLEVQEVPVEAVERPRLFQERLPNQRNPQRNQELLGVQVDQVGPVGPEDPVVQVVREVQVVRGDQEGLPHLVLEKRQSQPSQPRNRVAQVGREVPVDLVDQGAQEDRVVLEVPGDQGDPEDLEGQVVQEDPEVLEAPQQNLQERQLRRRSQPKTHLVSRVDPVDQMVQEVPEDPVVRVAQEVPADQEDREVTYQNTLHLLNILYFLLEDYVTVF